MNLYTEKATNYFIVFAIFVAATGLGMVYFNLSGANRDAATQQAQAYTKSLGLNVKGIECALSDTDHDGYVSCTASVLQPDGSLTLEALECASAFTVNSGCRMQKMGFVTRR